MQSELGDLEPTQADGHAAAVLYRALPPWGKWDKFISSLFYHSPSRRVEASVFRPPDNI